MIVYEGLKKDFLHSVEGDTIAMEIAKNILEKMGRHTADSEYRAFDNSMQYMHTPEQDDQEETPEE